MNSLPPRINLYFASVIGVPKNELDAIISDIDNHYNEWVEAKTNPTNGNPKTYMDGSPKNRVIRPPKEKLKTIQKRIKNRVLSEITLPINVHGGVKGKSNITNALPHKGKKYILTTDLTDFYPSIKSKWIYDLFIDIGFNSQFAFYATRLTTWKGELPQGAPTSTHLSNIFFTRTDEKLVQLCEEHKITYTRYVDDLTFSSPVDFQDKIPIILDIIQSSGVGISRRKTFYKGKQKVTGIIVSLNKISAPENILEKVKQEEKLPEGSPKPLTHYTNNINTANISKKR